MSVQTPIQADSALVVELAKAGGISLADERTIVAIIGGLATLIPGAAGHWLHVPANVQTVALVAFAIIISSHLLGLSTHRAAVETANGAVKQALIDAAQNSQSTVVADSPADVSGTVIPVPVPTLVDNVTPDVTAVGAGLPVVSAVLPEPPQSVDKPVDNPVPVDAPVDTGGVSSTVSDL